LNGALLLVCPLLSSLFVLETLVVAGSTLHVLVQDALALLSLLASSPRLVGWETCLELLECTQCGGGVHTGMWEIDHIVCCGTGVHYIYSGKVTGECVFLASSRRLIMHSVRMYLSLLEASLSFQESFQVSVSGKER
jgi:hypothetical protein